MIKLIAFLRRKPGLSHEEFLRHWQEVHGPLVRELGEFNRHLRRYVQNHPAVRPAADRAGTEAWDGVAELWFDSVDDMRKAFAEPCYAARVRPDELRFLDLPRCSTFLGEENVVHGG